MEVSLPIQAQVGRGGWKFTSLPPSLRFACVNPLRALPFTCCSPSGYLPIGKVTFIWNFFVAPTLRRVDGARKFRWRWKLGIRAVGMMPEMAAFPSRATSHMISKWCQNDSKMIIKDHFSIILMSFWRYILMTSRLAVLLEFLLLPSTDREREIGISGMATLVNHDCWDRLTAKFAQQLIQ